MDDVTIIDLAVRVVVHMAFFPLFAPLPPMDGCGHLSAHDGATVAHSTVSI
jgi:hypothetical protein